MVSELGRAVELIWKTFLNIFTYLFEYNPE